MSIEESDVGFKVAVTRQNAGTVNGAGGGAAAPRPPPPRPPPAGAAGAGAGPAGGVKIPAGTDSAIVMVVLGSETDFRPAHGVAASTAPMSTPAILTIIFAS